MTNLKQMYKVGGQCCCCVAAMPLAGLISAAIS